MTIERAMKILTPNLTRYTPTEYEEALALARRALSVLLQLEREEIDLEEIL